MLLGVCLCATKSHFTAGSSTSSWRICGRPLSDPFLCRPFCCWLFHSLHFHSSSQQTFDVLTIVVTIRVVAAGERFGEVASLVGRHRSDLDPNLMMTETRKFWWNKLQNIAEITVISLTGTFTTNISYERSPKLHAVY